MKSAHFRLQLGRKRRRDLEHSAFRVGFLRIEAEITRPNKSGRIDFLLPGKK